MNSSMKKLVAGITMGAFLLAPGAAFADTLYQVPVGMQKADDPSKASMASAALDKQAEVLVKDNGQSTYRVTVKPIEFNAMKGHLSNLFVYNGAEKVGAEKTASKGDQVTWSFQRPTAKEKDIKVQVVVDVMQQMGAESPDAVLRFDWDAAKVLKEDKAAEKAPETQPEKQADKAPAAKGDASQPVGNAPVQVFYNHQAVQSDSAPILKDGRTYLPLRAVFTTIGAKVDWKGAEQAVYGEKDGKKLRLVIGEAKATIDGAEKALDAPAFISNGRTYVPVRFVGEAFGNKVDYTKVGQIAVIDIR